VGSLKLIVEFIDFVRNDVKLPPLSGPEREFVQGVATLLSLIKGSKLRDSRCMLLNHRIRDSLMVN